MKELDDLHHALAACAKRIGKGKMDPVRPMHMVADFVATVTLHMAAESMGNARNLGIAYLSRAFAVHKEALRKMKQQQTNRAG